MSYPLAGDTDKAFLQQAVQLAMESVDARIPRIVFAAPQETANRAGFADGNIAEQLYGQTRPARPEQLGLTQIELENSGAPFRDWLIKHDRRGHCFL